jgi:predicted dehydrogenase
MAPGFDKGSLSAEAATRFPPKGSFREFVQQGLMDLREIDMDESNPLLTELTAFVAAVRAARGEAPAGPPGAPAGVSAEAGLRAMEVALRITEAIEGHRWS